MSNDTLLREVDEELRRDRMRKLWRQFAPYIFGAAAAVILLVAGYEGWRWYTGSNAARSSDQFYAATALADGTDLAAAQKALDDVIAQGSGAYPALAQFREASLLAQQGKIDEAVAAYDALSTNQSNPQLRELALVMGANLLIDKGDVSAVEQRVGGSIMPNSPMRNAAREVLGRSIQGGRPRQGDGELPGDHCRSVGLARCAEPGAALHPAATRRRCGARRDVVRGTGRRVQRSTGVIVGGGFVLGAVMRMRTT